MSAYSAYMASYLFACLAMGFAIGMAGDLLGLPRWQTWIGIIFAGLVAGMIWRGAI